MQICTNCQINNPALIAGKCTNCDYPLGGTVAAQRLYRNQIADLRTYARRIDDSSARFKHLGIICWTVLFAVGIFTLLFTPQNMYVLVALFLCGAFFFGIGEWVNPFNGKVILAAGVLLLVLTAAEFLLVGLPSPVLGEMRVGSDHVRIFSFFNSVTPYLYLAFRLALLVPCLLVFAYNQKILGAEEKMLGFVTERDVRNAQ